MCADKQNGVDYNRTLNLPVTDFPMRAGLPQREPDMLKGWDENRLYEKLMEKNDGKPLWVLHDGPPYANASIHIGTAMNKIIKDIIVRYRNMTGYKSPFVPGWDTHGLPIELKAREKAGKENAAHMPPVELRAMCRDHAMHFVNEQKGQFKRLGCIGDWEHPYLTLTSDFEKRQVEIFAEMAVKGYIYKGLKPVYWCADCETALAEAEIEYEEDPCYSVYVKFAVADDRGVLSAAGVDPAKTSFVIWTTTTWTLPANTGICLGPDFEYAVIEAGGQYLIMAKELAGDAMKAAGIEEYSVAAVFKGGELEYMKVKHPFLDRLSLVINGDHVTLESGTGCVHNAPGHGVDDFNMTRKYPELEIVVPVDNKGRMTEEAGSVCAGMTTEEASRALAVHMKETGALLATRKMVHQYPHCWRCHKPILFRATEQWFCSVESFKDQAVDAVRGVKWMPAWGEERMVSMIRERSDWCISRQRLWGVPIPIFYCNDCGKPVFERSFFDAVAEVFGKEGSDAWYSKSAAEILPAGSVCPHCGGTGFEKETDIMDVWFDSGTTHASVLDGGKWNDMKWPADLYMEGGDQYRGWFQSSLLTAVAWRGEAPYKSVLTHGWTVDGEGKKMSKSLGNTILPQEVVDQYGADILRLWVASLDYRVDVRLSGEILKQLTESYRKIRNTARFILGNLGDFDPDVHMTDDSALEEIDRWALMRLDELTAKVIPAYEEYEFHDAFHRIHNFCVVDLSNFYLDVIKDRLYVEKADSATRRAAQTTIYRLLNVLTRMLAPILAYTAEEIWGFMPHAASDDRESVLFNEIPKTGAFARDEAFMAKWERIHALRDDVKKALEEARSGKIIGGSLDAHVTLTYSGEEFDFVRSVEEMLPAVLIVSSVEVIQGGGSAVSVRHASGGKCVRCWVYDDSVGKMPREDLCARCDAIV